MARARQKLRRRQFIRLLGTAGAALAVPGCGSSPSPGKRDEDGPAGGHGADAGGDDSSETDAAEATGTEDAGADATTAGDDAAGIGADGGAPEGDGGAAGTRASLVPRELAASIEALVAYANTLAGKPKADKRTALLTFLRGRAEYVRVGESADGVWALHESLVPLMIGDNRDGDDTSALGSSTSSLTRRDVPKGTRARLINTMGTGYIDELAVVRPLLAAKGYSVVTDPGSIDSLRNLGGDGVLYMSAHGATCLIPLFNDDGSVQKEPDGSPSMLEAFGLWTSTPITTATISAYSNDLLGGKLGIGVQPHDRIANTNLLTMEAHFFVTSIFASDHWSFSKDSLAWISACGSIGPTAEAFISACVDDLPAAGNLPALTKAGLYVGWTQAVYSAAAQLGAKFVIDRLLGANLSAPKESPPQRPFDYEQVWSALRQRNLHLHPSTGGAFTELKYKAKPGGNFGMLAPSIAYVLIDEIHDLAILKGAFGEPPPDERAVLIGGLEAQVTAWTDDEIRVMLPRDGSGASGDVLVSVRGHDSNVRRISEWTMQFIYSWEIADAPPCRYDGQMRVRFRADVGPWRDMPGGEPIKPLRYAMATRDSTGQIVASGTHVSGSCTMTFSGVGDMPQAHYPENAAAPALLISRMRLHVDTKQLEICHALGAATQTLPWRQTITCAGASMSLPTAPPMLTGLTSADFKDPAEELTFTLPLPAAQLAFNDDWSLPAGTISLVSGMRLDWSPATAKSPPDPNAAC